MALHVLPDSTQAILNSARQNLPVHPGLELTKFVPWTDERREGKQTKKIPPEPARQDAFAHVFKSLKRAKDLARKWRERRGAWLQRLGDRARRVEVETVSPCVLWLAAPTALELGFCLHHTYGIPYLPGSALKGLARRQSLFANGGTDEQPDSETLRLFGEGGDTGHAGAVDFLDGIPLDPACLELDVMTPHHSNYYSGKQPTPHDCEDPVPINFLRIHVGARFEVALLCGPKGTAADLAEAERRLREGLADLGLGAKTSSGYGLFGQPQRAEFKGGGVGAVPGTTSTAPREVIAVVKSFDQQHVVFRAEDGEAGSEFSLPRADLDKRFQMTQQRWNQYRKSGQRLRIVLKGERVDSMEVVKS